MAALDMEQKADASLCSASRLPAVWRNCKKSKMPIIWICHFEFYEAQHHAKRRDAGLHT